MKIVLIGAGNVATSMGTSMKMTGHTIVALYSRTFQSAKALSDKLKVPFVTSIEELPNDADMYISMLKDDALMELASSIVSVNPNAIFVHTAGSLSLSLWAKAGASNYGVLYPMQTFSKIKLVDWKTVSIFVEGSSERVLQQIMDLAKSLSPIVKELDTEGRKVLHIAAVFACNFTNRMYAISSKLLSDYGVDFSVMLPLINETTSKVASIDPEQAQTGPAIRGDVRVMQEHLDLLSSYPEYRDIYRLISDNIQQSK